MLPDQHKNGMMVEDHAQLVLWKRLILLKHLYWAKKIDLAPTEQFFKYREKLVFLSNFTIDYPQRTAAEMFKKGE